MILDLPSAWWQRMVSLNHRVSLSLGALATVTAIKESVPLPLDDDFILESVKGWMMSTGGTSGEGPIYIGLADGDYTTAEIAEYFTASGPRGMSDKIEAERAGRNIVVMGVKHPSSTVILYDRSQQGAFWKKVRMTLSDVSTPTWFAFNDDDATLTTGVKVQGFIRYKGKWA